MVFDLILVSAVVILLAALFIINSKWQKKKKTMLAEIEQKRIENKELNSNLHRYQGIISLEDEIKKQDEHLKNLTSDVDTLKDKYLKALSIFKDLEREISVYENDIEYISIGIYEPYFDFDTSEKYKAELTKIINKQKELVKAGRACICQTNWHVGDSRVEGERMTKRYIGLTLRAFNGECNSLISKVKWNNIKRYEERIKKSFKAINKLGKSNTVYLTDGYLQLKLEELHLAYELAKKKQDEKEEQRQIRAEQREEERAIREFQKAQKDAEQEEKRFQKALEKAELGLVSGEKVEEMNSQIEQLKLKLKEAQEAKERAVSRAQETKSGHVYVVSNLGSFGKDIYKIGMTRRLEPMDRVKELGDASVPFTFDLHALIFSENAPELENLLHREFNDRRVNKVNNRKEYFNVNLDEIEEVIQTKYDEEVELVKLAEAQQYRETQTILNQLQKVEQVPTKYPENLFN